MRPMYLPLFIQIEPNWISGGFLTPGSYRASSTSPISSKNELKEVPLYYWTGTTHLDGAHQDDYAVYIAFG